MNAISTVTEPLWTLRAVAEATGGSLLRGDDIAINGVSIDSRTLEKGDLFVALRGPNFDGHDYIEAAFAAGAAAAFVSVRDDYSGPHAVVEDTMAGLEDLARAARGRTRASVAAITGSVGKTSAKEMLSHVLAAQPGAKNRVAATVGNLNNHWGLPLSLARMPADAAFGVFEIGMNHAGEIEPLSKIAGPDVALITAVEAVHIEFFESIEGIARAKAEIFAGIVPGGCAVLPRDNDHFELLRRVADESGVGRIVSFGRHPEADVRVEALDMSVSTSAIDAVVGEVPLSYILGVPGEHMAINSLGVLAVASQIGADVAVAADSLARFSSVAGRGRRHDLKCGEGTLLLIDEAYNASPASMRAAMQAVSLIDPEGDGRRIAVLGDMLELGDQSDDAHRGLSEAVGRAGFDKVFVTGRLMNALWNELPESVRGARRLSADELADVVAASVRPGDVVMVKGSKGSHVSRVVDRLIETEGA